MSTWKSSILPEELPYDKFDKYGVESLTDAELLAILIRTGTKNQNPIDIARKVLTYTGKDRGLLELYHLGLKDLNKVEGIGKVKSIQLLCVAEIAKRISLSNAKEMLDFNSSNTIANYYMEQLRHEEREHFVLCMLNNKCQLIKDTVLYIGTNNSALVSSRDIFLEALREQASYIIILHNHPSGDPTPSKEDKLMTERIRDASRLMDIPLLDHIIIGDNRYISFNELGIL